MGLKVPVPPTHVALVAAPPTEPARETVGLAVHAPISGPAFTVAAGLIVISIVSLTVPHGPAGSLLVNVNVTVPAVISAELGV